MLLSILFTVHIKFFCGPFNCSYCDKKLSEKPTARASLCLKKYQAHQSNWGSLEQLQSPRYSHSILTHSYALNLNKRFDATISTALNVSKSFGCKLFNSHELFSSVLLFTLRAVEWFCPNFCSHWEQLNVKKTEWTYLACCSSNTNIKSYEIGYGRTCCQDSSHPPRLTVK